MPCAQPGYTHKVSLWTHHTIPYTHAVPYIHLYTPVIHVYTTLNTPNTPSKHPLNTLNTSQHAGLHTHTRKSLPSSSSPPFVPTTRRPHSALTSVPPDMNVSPVKTIVVKLTMCLVWIWWRLKREAVKRAWRNRCVSIIVYPVYTFIAVFTPVCTRYTCIYTIYTSYVHL